MTKRELHTQYMRGWRKRNPFRCLWNNMVTRCRNPKATSFKDYGGRGIKLLWNSFEEFKNDMYPSYLEHIKEFGQKNTSLDRIDNNGHYSKENCRWATLKEQSNNTRFNRPITYKGETKNFCQWADNLGIKRTTLFMRIFYYKWPVKKAFSIL